MLGPILHPIILSKILSENRAEMRLKIPKDLAYFEGHFPGFPASSSCLGGKDLL